MQRFLRTEKLIGKERLAFLQNKKVTIVGLGAVGGYVMEAFARCGIRKLRLVDFDKINITNINRQILALDSTIGKLKVDAAVQRIKDINPLSEPEAFPVFSHTETLNDIMGNKPDLVIDAIDSVNPKAELLSYCYKNNITVLSSMGAALKKDHTKIRTGDIFDTKNCKLARFIRKYLKNRGVGRGILCVYSTEIVNSKYDDEHEQDEPDAYNRGRARHILGSLSTITGIFGLILANTAIEMLIQE